MALTPPPNPTERMQNNAAYLRAQTELVKAQTEYAKEVNKSKPETWAAMKDTVSSLRDLAESGGLAAGFESAFARIEQSSSLGFEKALAPITNIINEEFSEVIVQMAKAIEPLIPHIVEFVKWSTEILTPVIQWIADMIQALIDIFTSDPGPIEESPFYDELVALGKIKLDVIMESAGLAGDFTGGQVGGRRTLEGRVW